MTFTEDTVIQYALLPAMLLIGVLAIFAGRKFARLPEDT